MGSRGCFSRNMRARNKRLVTLAAGDGATFPLIFPLILPVNIPRSPARSYVVALQSIFRNKTLETRCMTNRRVTPLCGLCDRPVDREHFRRPIHSRCTIPFLHSTPSQHLILQKNTEKVVTMKGEYGWLHQGWLRHASSTILHDWPHASSHSV